MGLNSTSWEHTWSNVVTDVTSKGAKWHQLATQWLPSGRQRPPKYEKGHPRSPHWIKNGAERAHLGAIGDHMGIIFAARTTLKNSSMT